MSVHSNFNTWILSIDTLLPAIVNYNSEGKFLDGNFVVSVEITGYEYTLGSTVEVVIDSDSFNRKLSAATFTCNNIKSSQKQCDRRWLSCQNFNKN